MVWGGGSAGEVPVQVRNPVQNSSTHDRHLYGSVPQQSLDGRHRKIPKLPGQAV